MKLSPIQREHMIIAADDLDVLTEPGWSEYWVHVTERNKEYPFKQLVRKAYTHATGIEISTDFFQSNDGYRDYIEKKFQYPISFRVRDNIPFFTEADLEYFTGTAGKVYQSELATDQVTGEQLRKTIFAKTNTWARALNLDDFEIKVDNSWQMFGRFASYSWVRIFRPADRNRKIFFTVGVSAEEQGLIYKLDCQYRSHNPDNALTPEQEHIFQRMRKGTGAWYEIYADELIDYTWEKLIQDTRDFIEHYTALYEEVIEAVWNIPTAPISPANTLTERPAPKGIGQLPIRRKPSGGINNPDYDGENKERKKIGDAGEALVIEWERAGLIAKGRPDLAALVSKQPDWKGYDILSFLPDGEPQYLEVKTTTGTETRPFYWTRNEKQTMLDNAASYCLYRLYNFDEQTGSADFYKLEGDITTLILEEPIQYMVYIK